MNDFTVAQHGTDSSGRGIYATAYMWAWWQDVLDALPFGDRVVVTQSAFMVRNGGGAAASGGYHDAAGTFDLRVWNLTDTEVATLVRTLRAHGAAAWLRNPQHGGFADPHIHFVLGTDRPLSDGAASQWRDYLNGGDGIGGRDYHSRPSPLVTTPPEVPLKLDKEDQAWLKDAVTAIVKDELDRALRDAGDTIRVDSPTGTGAKWSIARALGAIYNRTKP